MTIIPLPVSSSESGGRANPTMQAESVVSMVRASTEPGGRDRFACSLATWYLLARAAESFGWKPRGTSYSSSRPAFIESAVRHDYEPGDARDQKLVDAQDALAWAMALNEARHSPNLLAMLNATVADDPDAAPVMVVMDEFVAYAFGGPFSFALEP